MTCRVFIQPRLNAAGGFQARQDITDIVVGAVMPAAKPETNEWSYGLTATGSIILQLADPDGAYGMEWSGASVFGVAGRAGAKVEIEVPVEQGSEDYVIIWRGRVAARSSETKEVEGISELLARSEEAVIFDSLLGAGAISEGSSMRDVVEAVLSLAPIVESYDDFLIRLPALADDILVADEVAFVDPDLSASKTLNQLLQIFDLLVAYDAVRRRIIFAPRGELEHVDYPMSEINSVLNILKLSEGAERVFNEFEISTGLEGEDEMFLESLDSSIGRWGLRKLELDLAWLQSLDLSGRIADYLFARIARARPLVEVQLSAWAIRPERVVIGSLVRLDVQPGGSPSSPAYGQTSYNTQGYERPRHRKIQGEFYIQEWRRDCVADTLTLALRAR